MKKRIVSHCCLVACCLLSVVVPAAISPAAEWQRSLYLSGGDYWRGCIRVVIENKSDAAADGSPVAVRIGRGPGEADLAGQRAEAIRACNAQGVELLFAIYGPRGESIVRGPIPTGSVLALPAKCSARQQTTYYVYFDNPSAGEVPDMLQSHLGVVNGDVEQGESENDAQPLAWTLDRGDAQHRVSWSRESPQSGVRCLKTTVDSGAKPSWIAARQRGIPIVGGAKYRLSGWVKAANVKGKAGWYVIVGNKKRPMLAQPSVAGGEGDYDWKKLTVDFIASNDADAASLGTMLYGTGEAWFDNVQLERLDGGERLIAKADAPERIKLAGSDAHAAWPAAALGDMADYNHRAAVRLFNFSDAAMHDISAVVDARMPAVRSHGGLSECLILDAAGKPVRAACIDQQLLLHAEAAAKSVQTYYVYWRGDRARPQHAADVLGKPDVGDQALRQANVLKNSNLAAGDASPANWQHSGVPSGSGFQYGVERQERNGAAVRCLKVFGPPRGSKPIGWHGWSQSVTVRPGRTYLVSAWVKTEGLTLGGKLVHLHQIKANGGIGSMPSIGTALQNPDNDWTFVSGTVVARNDAVRFALNLSTNGPGTVWYSNPTIVEAASTSLGPAESQPADDPNRMDVWQTPAVVKMFLDDMPPRKPTPLRISAARNEREPLQLGVRAGRDIAQASVEVEPPQNTDGHRLDQFTVSVVGYVPVDYPSAYYVQTSTVAGERVIPLGACASDGWPGLWPDPLLPKNTFNLKANVTQPLWITVSVPKNATPGDYSGAIRIAAAGKTLQRQPFTVHVWNFALPDESHVTAKFDVRLGPGEKWWNRSFQKLRPELLSLMASDRLCPDLVLPEPTFQWKNGRATADFTAFDRAAEHYFNELKFSYAWTPLQFYIFGWGFPPAAFLGEQPYNGQPPFKDVDREQLRPEYKKAYQACLKLFWNHVTQKGWNKKFVLYISDEPHFDVPGIIPQVKSLCRMIHEVDSKIPIYASTWKHVPEWDDSLDIWGFGHFGDVSAGEIAKLQSAGRRVWWTVDGQMCIDTPYCAVERLLPHYCFKYGAEAYEFWAIAWNTYDPNRFGWHAFIQQSEQPGQTTWIRYPSGDGFLYYPGHTAGFERPLSTIRLEQAREGIEDYEYLYLLRHLTAAAKQAGHKVASAEAALEHANRLVAIPNAGGCYSSKTLPDPESLYRLREEIAVVIEKLSVCCSKELR